MLRVDVARRRIRNWRRPSSCYPSSTVETSKDCAGRGGASAARWNPLTASLVVAAFAAACSPNELGDGRRLQVDEPGDTPDAAVADPVDAGFGDTGIAPTPDAGFEPDAGQQQIVNPFPNATVGRRCGVDTSSNYIVLSAAAASCQRHADIIDDWDGTPAAFAVLPQTSGQVEVVSTVCLNAEGCQQLPITFTIEAWTGSSGANGTWGFDLPNGARAQGQFNAGWCEYDEFLGSAESLASDLAVERVTVLQGTTAVIVDNGDAVSARNAPVIQGRAGLVRVHVRRLADFQTRDIVARLTIDVEGQDPVALEERMTVTADSDADDLDSTFNFELNAAAMVNSLEWNVGLFETAVCESVGNNTAQARYPADGTLVSMDARNPGTSFNVVLVPVESENGTLPNTSPAVVQAYRDELLAQYPVSDVSLTVRSEPLVAAGEVRTFAQWSGLLSDLQALRAADAPPANVYYYGLIETGTGGGIGGIAYRAGRNSASARVGVGRGPSSNGSADIMIHELGHTNGRQHAPCGNPESVDPNYPYNQASIGVNGYDLRTAELINPAIYRDTMGYCNPTWLSDYTFDAIFERLEYVNGLVPFTAWPERRVRVAVTTDQKTFWGRSLTVQEPVSAPVTVQFEDATGRVVGVGTADRIDITDGEGQVFYIPEAGTDAVQVRLPGGQVLPL